jgi:hypothetical protein
MNVILDKQDLLLASLIKFYDKDGNKELILPIVKQQTSISLRLLDWLVTNFAKQNDIHYEIVKNGDPKNFSIWLDYKNQLKAYSKKQFDPFCRRKRIFYNIKTNETINLLTKTDLTTYSEHEDGFVTTVGQLNFFRWALTHRVVDYAFDNLTNIESDMLMSADSRKLTVQGKRRRELSKVKKGVYKHEIKIVIQFP